MAGESKTAQTSVDQETPAADLADQGRPVVWTLPVLRNSVKIDPLVNPCLAVATEDFPRENLLWLCGNVCEGGARVEILDFGGGSLGGSALRGRSLVTRVGVVTREGQGHVFHGKTGQLNRGELNDMADGDRFAVQGKVNGDSERMRTDGTQ